MAYTFTQLAPDWDSLTDAEKEALFVDTNYQHATVAELQNLGEFKVLSFSDSPAGTSKAVEVKGVHNDILVLPNKLFGQSFNKIKSVNITEVITDTTNCKIRYILTKDLATYYTFDGTDWVTITPTVNTVLSDGLSSDDLASISSTEWLDFFDGDVDVDGIGIGFAFHETSTSQTTAVDNLEMLVDLQGAWEKAEHMVDYQYGYPFNDILQVQLLTNGDYKINYGSTGGGGEGGDTITIATNEDIDNLFN